jgi:methyltransferase-like protein 6
MFPLLQDYPGLNVIGFDFSPRAVAMIKQRPEFDPRRCDAWVGDIVREGVTLPAPYRERGGVDFATLLFVLSAMAPEEHLLALRNVAAALKPGGVLFIRDYAVYDLAQLRFKKGAKIAENYYVRWDGTRSYFFDRDTLQRLLAAAGFEVLANFYHRKVVRNVKKNLAMKRVWCQVRARRLPGALPPPPQP